MTPFNAALAASAVSAVVALVLSGTRFHRGAGQLARLSLGLALLAPLVAAAILVFEPAPPGAPPDAHRLGRDLSLLMKQAAALVPTAFMATLALQRARAARGR